MEKEIDFDVPPPTADDVESFVGTRKKGKSKRPVRTATKTVRKARIKNAANTIRSVGGFLVKGLQHISLNVVKDEVTKNKLIYDSEVVLAAIQSPLPDKLAEALDQSQKWNRLLQSSEKAGPWVGVVTVALPFAAAIVVNHIPRAHDVENSDSTTE